MDDQERPLNILMVAYACSPLRTSEHFLGWEWARRLSEFHRVTVITQAQRIAESDGLRPDSLSMLPVEVRGFQWLRRLGPLGQAVHLQLWQRYAARLGQKVLAADRFDLVHQTTFHTYRIPGLLARPGNPPFVWGPIAGLEEVPAGMVFALGGGAVLELVRRAANAVMPFFPSIRRTLKQSARVVVSNRQTLGRLQRLVPRRYDLLPANAIDPGQIKTGSKSPSGVRRQSDRLRLLAVGSFVRMRPLNLVIEAVAGLPDDDKKRLHIDFVGDGPDLPRLQKLVARHGIEECVSFLGRRPKDELFELMAEADLLVFPSLRDSGSSAISEALSLGLPVLALDLAGPSELLARGGGILVPARSPAQTSREIRRTLSGLVVDPSVLETKSSEAPAIALDFSWDKKIDQMNRIYREAVSENGEAAVRV